MNNSLYNFGAALLDSVDIFGKYFLNAVDAPWDIGLSRAKTGSLAGPLHTKALEERPASPQDGATKPDKNGGRRLLLAFGHATQPLGLLLRRSAAE